MDAAAGTVVGGRYRLEEPLASGGMGTVWRARHVELETDVAVKLMSRELLASANGEKRFRREAQAAARLKSPHIVQVFDYGVFEGQPYLAMELLDGEDLAARLEREGPLPAARVLALVQVMAKALEVAHGAELVHRDLKPANVFLHKAGGEEVLKVLDFGIAKQLGSGKGATTGAEAVGSPAYMSPEQVWGEEVGVETDTWALGVVAYEMLIGESPFDHEVLAKVFDRIVKAQVPSVRVARPELPEALDAFFARALARSTSERFHSARELAESLQKALDGAAPAPHQRALESAETLAAGVTQRVRQSRSPSGVVWVGLALGAAALAAIGFAASSRQGVATSAGPSAAATPAPAPASSEAPRAVASETPVPSASSSAMPATSRPVVAPSRSARPIPSTRPPVVDPKWGVPVQ